MAPKPAQEAAKKKAKKQKKVLILLALPLLGALGYAYSTLSSLGGSSEPTAQAPPAAVQAAPAAATTPAGAVPAASSPDATVTPGIVVPPVASLRSFTALGRKDPFHDNGPHAANGPPTASSTSGGGSTSKPSTPLTGAVIALNGKKLALALGTAFGHAPGLSGVLLFRLVKVSAKSAVIGVVGTRERFTLHVRRPLTLRQDGGWTYTLILEPLGTAAPMTVAPTANTGH